MFYFLNFETKIYIGLNTYITDEKTNKLGRL
jgi:hypothetical protein